MNIINANELKNQFDKNFFKKNRATNPIQSDLHLKKVFSSRKRGLIKKVMQLSILCKKNIFLCVEDDRNTISLCYTGNNPKDFVYKYLLNLNLKPNVKHYPVNDVRLNILLLINTVL